MAVLISLLLLPRLISAARDIINRRRSLNLDSGNSDSHCNNMEIDAHTQSNPTDKEKGQLGQGLMQMGSKSLSNGTWTQSNVDYYPPGKGNGSMLDSSGGLGEPLNVISYSRLVYMLTLSFLGSGYYLWQEFSGGLNRCWFSQLGKIHWIVSISSSIAYQKLIWPCAAQGNSLVNYLLILIIIMNLLIVSYRSSSRHAPNGEFGWRART